ncbi:unnamed protein product, partial [Arabidopsis halleri]
MKSCSSRKMMTIKFVTASLVLILFITSVASKGGGFRGGGGRRGGMIPIRIGSSHRNSGLVDGS